MKFLKSNLAVLLLGLMAAGAASADNFGMGIKAGTLGIGLEGTWKPIPWLDVRLGGSVYDWEDTGSQAGINYDGILALENYYLTTNFLFPVSPFRVTVGGFSNGNELQMSSLTTQLPMEIGNGFYDPNGVGTLESRTYFEDIAPYLGVGFDFSVFGKVGLNLDFGVLWQGEPMVELTATGPGTPGLDVDLEAERQELEAEFEDYKAFPVITLGFSFNFF